MVHESRSPKAMNVWIGCLFVMNVDFFLAVAMD